jgi:hypothetical protein
MLGASKFHSHSLDERVFDFLPVCDESFPRSLEIFRAHTFFSGFAVGVESKLS